MHPAYGIGTRRLCRTVAAQEKLVVKNVLVIVDHFTQYVQAIVMNNHTAYTTARVLYNNFFSVFGFPQKLMSDQGTEFTGDMIAVMCKLLGIEKIRTMPYHPQINGSAERVHQTLQRMICKLDPEKRRKWPEHIGSMLIAYNAHTVPGDRLLSILPYVQAETPVACGPVIPDSEHLRMDPYHRRICEGSL